LGLYAIHGSFILLIYALYHMTWHPTDYFFKMGVLILPGTVAHECWLGGISRAMF
jgi:hypothetical protein